MEDRVVGVGQLVNLSQTDFSVEPQSWWRSNTC